MGRNIRLAFWLVVIVQVVALLGFVGMREFTLRTGQEVVLQTVPVDPRDLFRGDYVVLRYDISRLPVCCYSVGDTVYVELVQKGEMWHTRNHAHRSIAEVDTTFIRGRVTRVTQQPQGPSPQEIDVEHGIESYFVPEGTGRDIERARGKLKVRVAVDGFGNAGIMGLVVEE